MTTDYVVHFEPRLLGLPIHNRLVTVEVGPHALRRVSTWPLPTPCPEDEEPEQVSPCSLPEVLAASCLPGSPPRYVDSARLGWLAISQQGRPLLVPAWRVGGGVAGSQGVPLGPPQITFLDAFTGELLEPFE